MKQDIHPQYHQATVTCSCGEKFVTGSTSPELRIEICSKCHPFYSGKQKFIDAGGRVDRFAKRYQKFNEAQAQKADETALAVEETSDVISEDRTASDNAPEPEAAEPGSAEPSSE